MTEAKASNKRIFPPEQQPSPIIGPEIMSAQQAQLNARVSTALETSPYLVKNNYSFETEEDRVILKGTVGSFYQKQMAQEVLRNIEGIREIQNQLQVNWMNLPKMERNDRDND